MSREACCVPWVEAREAGGGEEEVNSLRPNDPARRLRPEEDEKEVRYGV